MKNQKKNSSPGKIRKYFQEIIEIIQKPEMGLLPGQLAFYMLLSLVPLITLACYAANLFELDYSRFVDALDLFVPGGIGYVIPHITSGAITIPLIVLMVWMLYIASNGCNTIIIISNNIYGIRQSTWVKRRIKAVFMTVMIVIFVIALLLLSVYKSRIETLLISLLNNGNITEYIKWLEYPAMFIILFLFLRMFYNFAPDRMRNNTHINIGTLFTTIGWSIITVVYGMIASHMYNYEMLYGGLANVALIMIWLYFVSFIFVIGLVLNYGEEKEENN